MSSVNTPEYFTVAELAELLRLKERKIYDLAASGGVPCSRATGKLLFPARDVYAWIASHTTGPQETEARPPILLGSHDPLLDWAVRESRCGLATYFDGSLDGLDRFKAREGVACGLHVYHSETSDWNVPSVDKTRDAVLVGFARRRRGLVVRPDETGITGLEDLAGRRFAPRQPLSGTAKLFGDLAEEAGLDHAALDLAPVSRTETEAVQAVARGEADATFGLETLARDFGLQFLPLIEEFFDLLIDRRQYFEAPIQALLNFCTGDALREQAARLGGYDIAELGKIRWNA
ncbi:MULTISPECIES: helix-turn-helix transcriptional regulator [Mameliella]|uniref:helix-turn-helix transcriptional regulator n=1 Tax=Mameliella TaxID=1434019 RepID=UPI000B52CD9A|nr:MULTISPECIES: helix-turn-helix transcriptional regulator [Mameliella]MCR9275790.1 helix-turn-helix transcriptional regulator [Paracoccaceae bacterium]OWV63206.1 excisionase [Mameliella alba]